MSNFIGVDKLFYALMTSDEIAGASYGTPKPIDAAVKVNVDPDTPNASFYGDNILQESATFVPGGKISIEAAALPFSIRADLFGHKLDGKGGMIENSDDVAPYVAILYRRTKANGKHRWVKIYKAQFQEPKADADTKDASIKLQGDEIEGVFLPRRYDNQWRYNVDEEESNYVDISSTFFTSVEGIADATAPTVTATVPAANATAVPLNTTFVWTFSEKLAPSTVTADNFYLMNDATEAGVQGTLSYNATAMTVTFTPSTPLAATTKYIAVADTDVTDLAGNNLVRVAKAFTTAAA